MVAYANEAKQALLGVRPETLAAHGAVSEETAAEMATGVRKTFATSLGLSITGIAGPDGGSAEKPVGTVCFGLASAQGVVTRRYQLWGTRDWVKLLASQVALDLVRRHALGMPLTPRALPLVDELTSACARMRCFVAVDLSEEVRAAVVDVQARCAPRRPRRRPLARPPRSSI